MTRFVDKLLKVWRMESSEAWLLLHVEIQSQTDSGFVKQMFTYENLHLHRFQHSFGTEMARRGGELLIGKKLMGIKNDRVFQRSAKSVFKQAAESYLRRSARM